MDEEDEAPFNSSQAPIPGQKEYDEGVEV